VVKDTLEWPCSKIKNGHKPDAVHFMRTPGGRNGRVIIDTKSTKRKNLGGKDLIKVDQRKKCQENCLNLTMGAFRFCQQTKTGATSQVKNSTRVRKRFGRR